MAAYVPIPGATSARNNRSDVLATLPLVALGAVLVWLAFARGAFEPEIDGSSPASKASSPERTTAMAVALSSHPLVAPLETPFLYIIVFPPERVAAITALLAAESILRGALGEPVRRAELVGAAHADAAEALAIAFGTDFGTFPDLGFGAVIVP